MKTFFMFWGIVWGLLGMGSLFLNAPEIPLKPVVVSEKPASRSIPEAITNGDKDAGEILPAMQQYERALKEYNEFYDARVWLKLTGLGVFVLMILFCMLMRNGMVGVNALLAGLTLGVSTTLAMVVTYTTMLPVLIVIALLFAVFGNRYFQNLEAESAQRRSQATSSRSQSSLTDLSQLTASEVQLLESVRQARLRRGTLTSPNVNPALDIFYSRYNNTDSSSHQPVPEPVSDEAAEPAVSAGSSLRMARKINLD